MDQQILLYLDELTCARCRRWSNIKIKPQPKKYVASYKLVNYTIYPPGKSVILLTLHIYYKTGAVVLSKSSTKLRDTFILIRDV